MATWKCTNCDWKNAEKWDACANCGMPKNPTPEQLAAIKEKEERISDFLVTSTHILQGREILEYLGVVTGVVALGTGFYSEISGGIADILGTRSTAFQGKLEEARKAAMKEMIKDAVDLGANAVIALDLDYMEIGANVLMVSANGTAIQAADL